MKFVDLNEEIGTDLILEPIMESVDGRKRMFLEGIHAQAEVINGNRRVYPNQVLNESVSNYDRDYIFRGKSIGELNHPAHPKPNPERAAIFIRKLTMEGNNAVGKSEVLDNMPCGRLVYNLQERGVRLGVSTRGMGMMAESRGGPTKVTRYRMTAIDSVLDNSAPDAIPVAIMESAEWMYATGHLSDKSILDEMTRAKRLDSDDKIAAFASFMNRLAAKRD